MLADANILPIEYRVKELTYDENIEQWNRQRRHFKINHKHFNHLK